MRYTSFRPSVFLLHFFAQCILCFLCVSFLHASHSATVVDYTFYCQKPECKKTYSVYLPYFSSRNSINLGFTPSYGMEIKKDHFDFTDNTINLKNIELSEENLDLLFTPLTITFEEGFEEKNDMMFFNLFNKHSLEQLELIKKWYTLFLIDDFLLEKVILHIEDKKQASNNQLISTYKNPHHSSYYANLLQYKRSNNNNKKIFNIACLSGTFSCNSYNKNSPDNLNSLHQYLHKLEELEPPENITHLIFKSNSFLTFDYDDELLKFDSEFLENVRKLFINLNTLCCVDDANLHYSRDYFTFKNIFYDANNNFNPLTFCVDNPDQARKNIKKNILFFYKYSTLVPLTVIYIFNNFFLILGETISHSDNFPHPFGSLSLVSPFIYLIARMGHNKTGGGYPKKGYNIDGFHINSNAIINKSDLLWIIPMALHVCYLIQVCQNKIFNISFKTLLINRMYLIGFLICLNALKGFPDERLVYAVLSNENIFIQRQK